jgi:hypothetical protein
MIEFNVESFIEHSKQEGIKLRRAVDSDVDKVARKIVAIVKKSGKAKTRRLARALNDHLSDYPDLFSKLNDKISVINHMVLINLGEQGLRRAFG